MTWTPSRDEDAALVSGTGAFLDDLDPLPGTLVAAVVRSPHPHARIRGADLERARAHPGVAAVIGPDEIRAAVRPFPLSTATPMPYLPSAVDTARYVGEPVAVVVATDRYVAEDAAELVDRRLRAAATSSSTPAAPSSPTRRCCTRRPAPTSPPTARSPSAGSTPPSPGPRTPCAASTRSRGTRRCRWSATASSPGGARTPRARRSRRGRTSTARSRWCPSRPARSACRRAGSACTSPRTSAAASASSPASTPTSCSWPWPRSTRAVRCAGPRTGSSTCWRVRPAPDG